MTDVEDAIAEASEKMVEGTEHIVEVLRSWHGRLSNIAANPPPEGDLDGALDPILREIMQVIEATKHEIAIARGVDEDG